MKCNKIKKNGKIGEMGAQNSSNALAYSLIDYPPNEQNMQYILQQIHSTYLSKSNN